jgi:biotin-(acetyl-CoA carboxylase) ligase
VTEQFLSLSNFAKGKRVRVDTGSETYIGTTSGLTKEGLLQVEKEDGALVTVIAGDVTELK